MLTDAKLKEWKRLTEAATPHPWRWVGDGLGLRSEGVSLSTDGEPGPYVPSDEGTDVMVMDDPYVFRGTDPDADRAFIAAAREAMPALLAEVQRLRTPSGAVGRVGFDAFAHQRAADGQPPGPDWDAYAKDVPRWTRAWTEAGMAERAVAYALAAQHIASRSTWVAHDRRDVIASEVRALAQPPATASERMARLHALLREAGTLAGEVLADGDAPEVQRVTAEAIRRKLAEADDTERPNEAHLACWRVRTQFGMAGPDAPTSAECLQGAVASVGTALEMTRQAARRSSSAPLGRALLALEAGAEQLAAALKLDPVPLVDSTPGSPPSPRERRPEAPPDSPPLAELQHVSIGREGVTPAFRASVNQEDAKTPTEPIGPLKDGET